MNGQLTSNERIGQWIDERRRSGTGDPVCAYIYDLAGLRSHVSSMLDAMPGGARLYYAIKANPDRRMLETLLPLVAGFEVASAGELRLVREVSADVPVLFGGPGKKDAELREALRLGVKYVHVESLLELRKLLLFAEEAERGIDVLLRVNLRSDALPQTRITMGGRPTPFGLDESFVEEAIALLRDAGHRHVRFAGFHFHSLSNNLDAELHAAMVEYYVRRVAAWKAAYGLEIKAINAGGGFGVSYDSAAGFDWGAFLPVAVAEPDLAGDGRYGTAVRAGPPDRRRLRLLCGGDRRYQALARPLVRRAAGRDAS
ncbi:type III PLP-dependent enzyme domain-containing protein [Cohnella rhizosphaerae]|uniref:Alanine racemase n=1 Tax=Cohnella rhizosphaerae TaxID=1457232 RepID=A0A9X4QSP0_9BACL|nr:alanine racemase [Cohnella rhizosphaerae]MDG0809785.1 alanine racemase [Cohnella rhizosphaerae]